MYDYSWDEEIDNCAPGLLGGGVNEPRHKNKEQEDREFLERIQRQKEWDDYYS